MRPLRDLSQSGAFVRRAVISIGHSAALHLRGDAPSGFSVKWKCEIIRFIWFVTAVIRYYKLNVFFGAGFGAMISAEFSSQYRLLHLGERLWGLNLTPEINTFLRCCGCHNLHKSDRSPCDKIQIWESLQTFFLWLVEAFLRIKKTPQIILVFLSCIILNLIVFTDLKGFIWFWPFLCQWAPRAREPPLQEKGDLQDKVRILLRTKPFNVFGGRLTNMILVIYITTC